MVTACFDRECSRVNGRDLLSDGCLQSCRRSEDEISEILCDLNSCEDADTGQSWLADLPLGRLR